MAAVMIKLNTRARALATTAPLALVLGLRGGGDICPWTALGNMSYNCPNRELTLTVLVFDVPR